MVYGEAGSGKSHFFADIANSIIANGKPTFFFLGQNFTTGIEPWKQILVQLNLKHLTVNEFLTNLNDKGRLMNERVLVLVDAINEGQGLRLWPTDLESFVLKLDAFPYLALVHYEIAFDITQKIVEKFSSKKRFLDDLISENVFVDEVRMSRENLYTPIYNIAFAYQRLGDHFRAVELINKYFQVIENRDLVFSRRFFVYF